MFPQFGPWKLGPNHGFARINRWTVAEQGVTADEEPFIVLTLKENERTLAMWPHPFALKYSVTLKKSGLTTHLEIQNTGPAEFEFTTLLHTYFRVPDLAKTSVSGLEGLRFIDKVGFGCVCVCVCCCCFFVFLFFCLFVCCLFVCLFVICCCFVCVVIVFVFCFFIHLCIPQVKGGVEGAEDRAAVPFTEEIDRLGNRKIMPDHQIANTI